MNIFISIYQIISIYKSNILPKTISYNILFKGNQSYFIYAFFI